MMKRTTQANSARRQRTYIKTHTREHKTNFGQVAGFKNSVKMKTTKTLTSEEGPIGTDKLHTRKKKRKESSQKTQKHTCRTARSQIFWMGKMFTDEREINTPI